MISELGSEMISDKLPNSSINSYFNWENQINWNGILLNSWVPELHGRFFYTLTSSGDHAGSFIKIIFRYLLDLQRYFHMHVSCWAGFLDFIREPKLYSPLLMNHKLWWNVGRCLKSKWSNVYFPYVSYHVFTGHVISLDVTWRSGMIKTIWKCLDTLSM